MFTAYAIPGMIRLPEHGKIEIIINAVCEYYEQEVSVVKSKARHRRPTWCRQVCIYITKKQTLLTLNEIAGIFGGRDHTTALHSIQTVKDIMDTNEWLRDEVWGLEQLTKSKIIAAKNIEHGRIMVN